MTSLKSFGSAWMTASTPMTIGRYLPTLLLLLLVGCASPKPHFESRKDPAYSKKLEKVLLFYKQQPQDSHDVVTHQLGKDFSERLAGQIKSLLEQLYVPCEILCLKDKLELDIDAPIREASSRFGASQQLAFVVKYIGVGRMTSGKPQNNKVILEFTLWDSGLRKVVWRTEATFIDASPLDQDAAGELIEELAHAELL